mmetsp:Transcript_23777/g.56319  ORF Transcript_23777/g.56319 Transcript_23777/m.56319 type:complete len:238 (-) Transcript_23777:429-1142(-)
MPVIFPSYTFPSSGGGPAYSGLGSRLPPLPPPPPPPEVSLTIISLAFSIWEASYPEICTSPLSSTLMLDNPKSSISARICFPPGPMTLPMESSEIFTIMTLGTVGGSSPLGSASAFSISPRMWILPSFAWWRARAMVSSVSPSHLMSSWNVVMPSLSPATLKSIVPSASSVPRMSDTMTAFSSDTSLLSPRSIPMAMPATGLLMGTPASIRARQPPQTDAIDEDPLDSVTSDSTRIV